MGVFWITTPYEMQKPHRENDSLARQDPHLPHESDYFLRAAIFALISARRSFGASALAISALIAASIFSIVFNELSE